MAAVPNVSGLGTAFLGKSVLRQIVLRMYRFGFTNARHVFFQNPDDQALFLKQRIVRPGQSSVLPGSGVDPNDFAITPLPRRGRFLMIARLLGDKGVREYVAAARVLKEKRSPLQFALLGELDEQNPSAIAPTELEQWQSEGIITYLGSTSDVRQFIQASSAVVLPSYREGLPRTLLEGAAMARPLIATDVPGCRELVREGITGFLCQPRSVESPASAMESFAGSSYAQRSKIGRQARAMVERDFHQEIVFQSYREILARMIS